MLVIAVLLGGYIAPLRSVSRPPRKKKASSPPPLALFSQDETSQIKLFTQLFPKGGSFGQKWVKDGSGEQLQVPEINLLLASFLARSREQARAVTSPLGKAGFRIGLLSTAHSKTSKIHSENNFLDDSESGLCQNEKRKTLTLILR